MVQVCPNAAHPQKKASTQTMPSKQRRQPTMGTLPRLATMLRHKSSSFATLARTLRTLRHFLAGQKIGVPGFQKPALHFRAKNRHSPSSSVGPKAAIHRDHLLNNDDYSG